MNVTEVRDIDKYKSDIQTALYSTLINVPKVKYEDRDIAIIESELRATTQTAVNDGILKADPAPVIFIPRVMDIPVNDRANRVLPDITITCYTAGSVHFIDPVTITLKV